MKIAIAGYGVEGEASYKYWNTPSNEVTIVDSDEIPARHIPDGAAAILGHDALDRLDGFDLVIRTAGLAPSKIKTTAKVWSSTNEFFSKCPAPIIGVTGSKGKGTTSSLIASILRAAGFTVHLVGNIGIPALDVLAQIDKSHIVVYELSSFQLWDLEFSPHVGVVVHIEEDHMDVHASIEEYITAKGNIARYQHENDQLIYNIRNKWATEIASLSAGNKIPYPAERTAHVRDSDFWYGEQLLCSARELQLPGVHNQENACAAITATWTWVQDGDIIAEGMRSFKGLPHRLKFVREVDSVKYYDDSIATTSGSAIAAVNAFNHPKVIILGGSSKGADFSTLASELMNRNVKLAILIGSEANNLELALRNTDVQYKNLGSNISMMEIIDVAREHAEPGDIVILSPACASFDMFKSYVDRGNQFINAVNLLPSGT